MATARYWRAALCGRFVSGTWLGEIAQTGISGCCIDSGGDFPPSILEPLPEFQASASGEVGSWANGTVEYGSLGSGNWTKANQNELATALYKFAQAIRPYQSTTFVWDEVRISAVQADGKIVNGASVFTFDANVQGQVSNPPDVTKAVVISTRSGGRSPRARGRLYVPTHEVNTQQDPAIVAAGIQNNLNASVADLIDDATVSQQVFPAIVSRTGLVYSRITQVRCGDEFDRMQSRRRKRREVYSALDI